MVLRPFIDFPICLFVVSKESIFYANLAIKVTSHNKEVMNRDIFNNSFEIAVKVVNKFFITDIGWTLTSNKGVF